VDEREFTIEAHGESVRGVLWLPEAAQSCPLVLTGHGLGQHKRVLFPATLARELTRRGFCVAAIDAPAHGARRQPGDSAVGEAWSQHWRDHGASRIAEEYSAIIALLRGAPEVDAARVGYWGLSLATQYGIGLLALEPKIRAGVLGLFSLAEPGRRMREYAPRVRCPVFFIEQLDDELHPAQRGTALFNLLASTEKTLRVSPGGHVEVPLAVFEDAYDFLVEKFA
jgi:dienelactone hydrolase